LKYEVALGALVHALDDLDSDRNDARRAAQALADIHGWPFEWGDRSSFEDIQRRARARYSGDFVAACLAALKRGRLELPEGGGAVH
jgi:hypothetical protein